MWFPAVGGGQGWILSGYLSGSEGAMEISRGQAAGAAPGTIRPEYPPRRGGGKCANTPFPASLQDATASVNVTGGGDRQSGLAPG